MGCFGSGLVYQVQSYKKNSVYFINYGKISFITSLNALPRPKVADLMIFKHLLFLNQKSL